MKTTKLMIENQIKWLAPHFPGVALSLDSVNYYNPGRRYCLFADGVKLTGWLLAGEFYQALKGMNNALELKSKLTK